jgi:allantoinase
VIDPHVHVNEPGRTEWEGFGTAGRAAAAGGVTCLVDMPLNSLPVTTTAAALEVKARAAVVCRVDHGFWGGVVPGNLADLEGLIDAGVLGFKCFLVHSGIDEFPNVERADLEAAMPMLARQGLPLLVHAELPGLLNPRAMAGRSPRSYAAYLASRPDESERAAIEMMVGLCDRTGCRVHFVHVSSAASLSVIAEARARGLPISAETCPHYLAFAAEEIPDGATQFKCAPPIRDRAHREALWAGLRGGVLDLIASDHSPCPPDLKRLEEGDFGRAWGGISSLQLGLSVVWTHARARGLTLRDVARWMAAAPARLIGAAGRKGRIAAGMDADMIVFEPDEEWTVTAESLHHRHPLTPYLGVRLPGRVRSTMVRGRLVYDRGSFIGPASGMRIVRG